VKNWNQVHGHPTRGCVTRQSMETPRAKEARQFGSDWISRREKQTSGKFAHADIHRYRNTEYGIQMAMLLRGISLRRIIPTRTVSRQYCSACPPRLAPSAVSTSTQSTREPTPDQAPLPLTSPSGSLPDHRHLATEQNLFFSSPVSPGSPLFLPNGTRIFHKLQEFLRAQYAYYGFQEVLSPTIYKRSLWEQSGHWEKYGQDMFVVTGRGASGAKETLEIGEEEEYGLKPMNCPGHCLIFKSSTRSHRELPVRYADFSPLHR